MLNLYNNTIPPSSGSVSGGITIKSGLIDFGAVPVYSKACTLVDGAAVVSSKILASAAPSNDEYEMDGLLISGTCLTNGTITLYAQAIPGPVTGVRNINYTIG